MRVASVEINSNVFVTACCNTKWEYVVERRRSGKPIFMKSKNIKRKIETDFVTMQWIING